MIQQAPPQPVIRRACDRCRLQKLRCPRNGTDSACLRCAHSGLPCVFNPSRRGRRPIGSGSVSSNHGAKRTADGDAAAAAGQVHARTAEASESRLHIGRTDAGFISSAVTSGQNNEPHFHLGGAAPHQVTLSPTTLDWTASMGFGDLAHPVPTSDIELTDAGTGCSTPSLEPPTRFQHPAPPPQLLGARWTDDEMEPRSAPTTSMETSRMASFPFPMAGFQQGDARISRPATDVSSSRPPSEGMANPVYIVRDPTEENPWDRIGTSRMALDGRNGVLHQRRQASGNARDHDNTQPPRTTSSPTTMSRGYSEKENGSTSGDGSLSDDGDETKFLVDFLREIKDVDLELLQLSASLAEPSTAAAAAMSRVNSITPLTKSNSTSSRASHSSAHIPSGAVDQHIDSAPRPEFAIDAIFIQSERLVKLLAGLRHRMRKVCRRRGDERLDNRSGGSPELQKPIPLDQASVLLILSTYVRLLEIYSYLFNWAREVGVTARQRQHLSDGGPWKPPFHSDRMAADPPSPSFPPSTASVASDFSGQSTTTRTLRLPQLRMGSFEISSWAMQMCFVLQSSLQILGSLKVITNEIRLMLQSSGGRTRGSAPSSNGLRKRGEADATNGRGWHGGNGHHRRGQTRRRSDASLSSSASSSDDDDADVEDGPRSHRGERSSGSEQGPSPCDLITSTCRAVRKRETKILKLGRSAQKAFRGLGF